MNPAAGRSSISTARASGTSASSRVTSAPGTRSRLTIFTPPIAPTRPESAARARPARTGSRGRCRWSAQAARRARRPGSASHPTSASAAIARGGRYMEISCVEYTPRPPEAPIAGESDPIRVRRACAGQSSLSSRDSARSASSRPPVWQRGAVVGLVLGVDDALHRRAAVGAGLAEAAVHRHPVAEGRHLLREAVAGLGAQPLGPLGERRPGSRAKSRSISSSVELARAAGAARAARGGGSRRSRRCRCR